MKKDVFFRLAGALVVLTTLPFAKAQTEFSAQIGANLSEISFVDQGNQLQYSGSFRGGFTAGVSASVEITEDWRWQPSFQLMRRGSQVQLNRREPEYELAAAGYFSMYYLRLPLGLTYHLQDSEKGFYLLGGPYLGLGLGGDFDLDIDVVRDDTEENLQDGTLRSGVKFINSINDNNVVEVAYSDSYFLDRLDLGLNIGAGYRYKKFYAQLSYDLGVTNLEPNTRLGIPIQVNNVLRGYNRSLLLTLGWYF